MGVRVVQRFGCVAVAAVWLMSTGDPMAVAWGEPVGATEAQNAPRIEFAETSYDFGTVKMGPRASHIFTFRNTGNAALTLLPPRGS